MTAPDHIPTALSVHDLMTAIDQLSSARMDCAGLSMTPGATPERIERAAADYAAQRQKVLDLLRAQDDARRAAVDGPHHDRALLTRIFEWTAPRDWVAETTAVYDLGGDEVQVTWDYTLTRSTDARVQQIGWRGRRWS